jgi:4-diphosphocytidyl-2-C-methyl-D-erythritol kinase
LRKIEILAPAKVNLFLKIVGKRGDGYHLVETVIQTLNLSDKIILEEGEFGISISTSSRKIPSTRENLAYKAAEILLNHKGGMGVNIYIDKNIPVASGLGGGSSDAAATLVGLNELWNLRLGQEELIALGREIGVDVPFFIRGGTGLAKGVGDEVLSLPPLPPLYFVLVNPGFGISTQWVYENLNLELTNGAPDIKIMLSAVERGDVEKVASHLFNALESVVLKHFPIVHEMKEKLRRAGAMGALMSGSGPTVFGLTLNEEKAKRIAWELKEFLTFVTKNVPHGVKWGVIQG